LECLKELIKIVKEGNKWNYTQKSN
jgi:hypothetical protein